MKKVSYTFYDSDSKEIVRGEFLASTFTTSSWGVMFTLGVLSEVYEFSWDELRDIAGDYVCFGLSLV